MPAIGSLDFSYSDGLDAGVALLLVKPPQDEIRATFGDCQILASPASPHLVCRFKGLNDGASVYARGTELAQESLDVLSMLGRGDLLTRDTDDEHILWWSSGRKRTLFLVSTATFPVKVGSIQITVKDASGNVVTPVRVTPKHHIGFRFYRLAQASDDLYDAFRNMYLAFESLLSTQFPKGSGLEIDWLRRSLTTASSDLSLTSLVPATVADPVDYVLGIVYRGARLPLFHAKDGRAYFAPSQSSTDRRAVEDALSMLTNIVLRMADTWYSAGRTSSWVNLSLLDSQYRQLFADSRFVFTDDPAFTLKEGLNSPVIDAGVSFPATFNEQFKGILRHNICGTLPTSLLAARGKLHAIYLVNNTSPLISFSPDTTVDWTDFDELSVCLFVRSRNAGQPKYMYAR